MQHRSVGAPRLPRLLLQQRELRRWNSPPRQDGLTGQRVCRASSEAWVRAQERGHLRHRGGQKRS